MNANKTITLTSVATISLISGSDLQVGAAYRFTNVTSGIDAIVTVDALANAKINNIDAQSGNSSSDKGWNPSRMAG